MKFIIASNNKKKLVELERILNPLGINAVTPKEEGITLDCLLYTSDAADEL